jgi:hypothetical protein
MTHHLSDEQFNSALLAENDSEATRHLEGCESCRIELERVRAFLGNVRAESLAGAERPQIFWREQRHAIASRLPVAGAIETRPLAWAGSLAIFALAAAWMTHSASPVQPQRVRSQSSASVPAAVDPDHMLLVDIQRSVRRDVPRALEPATLLAQELHRAANRKSDR